MTVITITTKNHSLLPLLQQWLQQNDTTASIEAKEGRSTINWTDERLDDATHQLVLNSIERHKNGDTSNLIKVKDLKEIFYDL